jgi:hypothetical protein
MNETQPNQPYSGITRHAGKWLVKLRHRRQDVTIGHYEDPAEAAATADYLRYLLYGLRPTCWPARVAKPNGPPNTMPFDHGPVLREIWRHRLVPFDTLLSRMVGYSADADEYAKRAPLQGA